MSSLYALIYLLMGLLGYHSLNDAEKMQLKDPAIAAELGIDPNCPDCDQDQLKQRYYFYKEDKDGGTVIDALGAQ